MSELERGTPWTIQMDSTARDVWLLATWKADVLRTQRGGCTRQTLGARPCRRLKARLKASSES